MIQFDNNAGTHFEGKEISVSKHAIEEAITDFRIPEDEARDWIREQLRRAQYIGEIYGENNSKSRLFGYQRIAFIVAPDADVVITIYPRHKVDQTLRAPIEKIIQDAVSASVLRVRSTEEAASKVIAGFQAAKIKARAMEVDMSSGDVRDAVNVWIADLDEFIDAQEKEIEAARMDHARLLKGVVAYV